MANFNTCLEPTLFKSVNAAPAQVSRTPFYFQSQGEWLFAWLHRRVFSDGQTEKDERLGATKGLSAHGIILCSPIGYEQLHAHRGWRHLADALAEAGFTVLRFDYHGTGDSAGNFEDPDRHSTWMANVRSALSWMLDELECERVSVIGLRLGAALAVQVAADMPITDLVLWAPVVKGRAYVREMKALAMAAGQPAAANGDLEAAGFVMTRQTLRDLAGIDLFQTRPQCRRALIVDRDDVPAGTELLNHWRSLNIEARQVTASGYAGMMAEPHLTDVPYQAIAEIVAWISERSPDDPRKEGIRRSETSVPTSAVLESTHEGCVHEQTVQISRQPDLFGILSEPATRLPLLSELPAVVLVNAGSTYRAGPNRLHVLCARRLATRGLRCLRLDISGLGDSIASDPARENDPYAATAFRDVDLAMKYLGRELGVKRVILMGLCSGAYVSFQAAAQFPRPHADSPPDIENSSIPDLVESILVNPLTFYWQDGMAVESPESLKLLTLHKNLASARCPGKWLKLLTGRSKLGIRGAFRILLDGWKLRRQARQGVQPRAKVDELQPILPSHPRNNDLVDDLTRISKNGRLLTFLFARSDPGYQILTFHARRQIEEMCRVGQARIGFIEEADHTFTRLAPREAFLQAIIGHISGRYLEMVHDDPCTFLGQDSQ